MQRGHGGLELVDVGLQHGPQPLHEGGVRLAADGIEPTVRQLEHGPQKLPP